MDTDEARNFLKAFKERYKTVPVSVWAVLAGDAYKVLEAAIAKGNDDPEKIAAWLKQLKDLPTLSGKMGFDEKGRPCGRFLPHLQGGQRRQVRAPGSIDSHPRRGGGQWPAARKLRRGAHDRDMEQFFQQLLNGLAVGGIYALVALGYTMVYGVLKLINFAHGDLFTIGAYLGLTLLVSCNLAGVLPPVVAVLAVFIMVGIMVAIIGCLLGVPPIAPCARPGAFRPWCPPGRLHLFQNAVMLVYGALLRLSRLAAP